MHITSVDEIKQEYSNVWNYPARVARLCRSQLSSRKNDPKFPNGTFELWIIQYIQNANTNQKRTFPWHYETSQFGFFFYNHQALQIPQNYSTQTSTQHHQLPKPTVTITSKNKILCWLYIKRTHHKTCLYATLDHEYGIFFPFPFSPQELNKNIHV